ncbi:uncharacterized protein [Trachinotus anak]|uniref:uncharacterized protein isoform X5 n=1 Tax=Trachinotus anak TaxID=443729 RepID=UPI0039F185CE
MGYSGMPLVFSVEQQLSALQSYILRRLHTLLVKPSLGVGHSATASEEDRRWRRADRQAFVGCAKKTCRGEDALIQRRMQTFMLALEGTKWDLTSNTSVPSKVVASSRLSHLKRRLFTGISRILMRKCLRKMTESSQREKAAGPHYTDMAAGPQTTQTETVPGPLSRVGEMKMIQAPLTSKMDPVNNEKCQNYRLVCTTISSLDKCIHCVGPGSSFKWLGYKCKVCSGVWHKSCLRKITNDDFHHPSQVSIHLGLGHSCLPHLSVSVVESLGWLIQEPW